MNNEQTSEEKGQIKKGIADSFTGQANNDSQVERKQELEKAAIAFAELIVDYTGGGERQASAVLQVKDALKDAKKAIDAETKTWLTFPGPIRDTGKPSHEMAGSAGARRN